MSTVMRFTLSILLILISFNANALTSISDVGIDVNMQQEISCLASNIYYEARNESFDGKVAVGQVTMNRVNSGKFPDTICGVVHQRTKVFDKTVCQFSWQCDHVIQSMKISTTLWEECFRIAALIIGDGLKVAHLPDDALYFHNTQVNPGWNLQRVAKIDNHIFYAPKKSRK